MKRLPMLLLTAACSLLPALAAPLMLVDACDEVCMDKRDEDEAEAAGSCTTDSHCLEVCSRALQRVCTDEDIFGPPCEDCGDEPEDEEVCHAVPGDCEREGK